MTQPDYAKAIWKPSPNFWPGRNGHAITAIVLHGTAGGGAVEWFAKPESQVSSQYVVEMDGRVIQCVSESDSAWHCGIVTADSKFYGQPNPNLTTIGIEHTRDIHNLEPMPKVQIDASLALVKDILHRHGKLALWTHDQFSVGRTCPGPNFPTAQFLDLLKPHIKTSWRVIDTDSDGSIKTIPVAMTPSGLMVNVTLIPWEELAAAHQAVGRKT